MLTCRNFEHWKLWVKIGFSHIFTYCTEQHTKSSSYWRHLCGKVALIPPQYSGESCILIYVAHCTHRSFKVEIPQIRKWKCNENLWILQRTAHWSEGHSACKVHLNASNFNFLNIRTHPCNILYQFQDPKFHKNRIFCVFKRILHGKFRQHLLTRCCPTFHFRKVWGLSFQTHYLSSSQDPCFKKYNPINIE